MERLTERLEDGQAMLKCTDCRAFGWLRACTALSCRNMLKDRLAAYEDAEEHGLLIRLPCKVGTPCWKIWQFGGEFGVTDWVFDHDDISYFGETVFLTREEAEAALAKDMNVPDKEG